jgi:hypothetical protein
MGVEAAGRDLEDIAPPLSATGEELEEPGEQHDPYTLAPEEGRKHRTTSPRFERDTAAPLGGDAAEKPTVPPEVNR